MLRILGLRGQPPSLATARFWATAAGSSWGTHVQYLPYVSGGSARRLAARVSAGAPGHSEALQDPDSGEPRSQTSGLPTRLPRWTAVVSSCASPPHIQPRASRYGVQLPWRCRGRTASGRSGLL